MDEAGIDASKTINNELTPIIAALQAENPNAILKTEKPTTPCRGRVVLATISADETKISETKTNW